MLAHEGREGKVSVPGGREGVKGSVTRIGIFIISASQSFVGGFTKKLAVETLPQAFQIRGSGEGLDQPFSRKW